MIEERETGKEEGTRTWLGRRRDKGGREGERGRKKVFEQENRKFPWPHLKPQQLWVRVIFHNQSELANLGLPHLLKGCFGVLKSLSLPPSPCCGI